MKGMKNIGLAAILGLLVSYALSLPAYARNVTIATSSSGQITGIGDLTGNPTGSDQVEFTGLPPNTVTLTANIAPTEQNALRITLGEVSFTQNQNCQEFACTDPLGPTQFATLSGYPLRIGLSGDGSQQQFSNLNFQEWSTQWDTYRGFAYRNSGSLIFSPFQAQPLIFNFAFDTLIIQLLKPQDIIDAPTSDENTGEGLTKTVKLEALVWLIPEPSSIGLMGIGLLAMAFGRKPRRKGLTI